MKKFILILYIFCHTVNSQVLFEKELIDHKHNLISDLKIENVFLTENNMYFSLLEGERYVKSTYSMQRNFILQDIKGVELRLKVNEYPLEIVENNLYTFTEFIDKHEREYSVYQISNGTLNKKSSLSLSISSSASVLKNGDLIITEGGHSGRDWIGLYTKELKKLHEFKPFNDESNISYDRNENYIAYVGQIGTDSKIRMAIYGAFANKGFGGSQEIDIDQDLILSSVKVVKENVVILLSSIKSGHSQILIIDKDFNVISKIKLSERASHNKIVALNNDFYINTNTTIYSFGIEKGEKKWEIKKEGINAEKTQYGYKFRGSNLYSLNNSYLILLEANYEDKVQEVKDVIIKIIDVGSQKIIQEIKTQQTFIGDVHLIEFDNEIVLFANNNYLRYEKK